VAARGATAFSGIAVTYEQVLLLADGQVSNLSTMVIDNPPRLVLDFPTVAQGKLAARTASTIPGITAIRVGRHRGKTRVVLVSDRHSFPNYRLVPTANGLRVALAVPPVKPVGAAQVCPDLPVAIAEIQGGILEEIIRFEISRYDIPAEFDKTVQRVGRFMKDDPETAAVIEGHADNTGSVKGNMTLSRKRAQQVAKRLTRRYGISPSRISIAPYGCTLPTADNGIADGRRKNRRTVVIVLKAE
jgi:outer membrane protein OmpA-like peptidoglycan-associated protein